ncbi:hypothetical protein PFICI_09279 [Pestalotiopsis fici W106-1]|uniref:F-box domain-containing protein n=1 Tax=Pestalotiopsis fici (strain W106-1 / CGMCC3.15140) TaxID=1229662 RepID=W3X2P2_PESFW|nr:uncharacterized protein PFICI_09279 [Pestalotiopsis fici W106-1]ETS79426.1 hypothetical protein PFICI_09279 [Pestalotiopsis fici W106-1]
MQKRKRPAKEKQQKIWKKKDQTGIYSSRLKRARVLPFQQASLLQSLPDDVLYYLARTFLWEPTDIFDLARTSRSLWGILEREIYITDVFAVQYHVSRGLEAPRTTLLHWAALAGRTDILSKALAAAKLVWTGYMNFQHSKCGHAAIHFAAHYGRLEVVRALQREKEEGRASSVDMTAASGWMCPAPQRLQSILQRLTPGQFRVPPEYMLQDEDFPFKIDALGLAILKGHRDVAMHLLDIYDAERIEEEKIFPPLHLAAFVGMAEVVESILSRGINVSAVCKHVANSVAIHWAAAGSSKDENTQTLRILREYGADITIRDSVGRTPLDWAIGFKNADNVLYLLKRSIRSLAPGHLANQVEEWTKRLQRCMADDLLLDCTKFILKHCPRLPEECLKLCVQSTFWDIDRSWDEAGCVSTSSKNLATKRWLVDKNIGLGVLSKGARQSWMQEELFQGRCFLHYAAGSTDIDAELLALAIQKRPHDIDVVDAKGLTPLELALGYRCIPEKVKLLLRSGANPALCYGGERARADVDRQIEQLTLEEEGDVE